MFGIGMSEMVIILAVALLVFGPDKLPEIAKTISKGLKELRRASDDLRTTVSAAVEDDEPRARPSLKAPPKPAVQASAGTPDVPPNIPGSEAAKDLPPPEPAPSLPIGVKPASGAVAHGDVDDVVTGEAEQPSDGGASAMLNERKLDG